MKNNEKERESVITEEDMDEKDTADNVNNNKEESREFYVYKHIRKDNNTCFYVGKGKGRRMYVPKRNKHFNRIRKKYGCYVVKIKENLTEKEAFALEREIIEDYVFVFGYGINIEGYNNYDHKLPHLTNCTWGGEGVSGLNAYANKTEEEMEEIRRKKSESMKGKNKGKNSFAGKTPEEMEEIGKKKSEAMKGKNAGEKHGMWGKKQSEEAKQKMSEKRKGKPSPNKGKKQSEEAKQKISEKLSKKVICITTGKIFNSLKKASDHYNVTKSSISECCNGKLKHAGKLNGVPLQWKYAEDDDNESKAV